MDAKKLDVIHELANRRNRLGKTVMMKYIFLLQQVYKVPLGYDFEIYTYGPYSSEVTADVDFAKYQELISIELNADSMGYSITPKNCSDKSFSISIKDKLDELMRLFGNKTARDLELSTTIVYLYSNYKKNSWDNDCDTLSNDVYEIKPHFSLEDIKSEYANLEENGILELSIA